MKRVYFATIFVFYVLLCNAQTMDFNKFQKLFKKIEIPFVLDSCSVDDLVFQDDQFPKISKRMKNYISLLIPILEIYVYLKKMIMQNIIVI